MFCQCGEVIVDLCYWWSLISLSIYLKSQINIAVHLFTCNSSDMDIWSVKKLGDHLAQLILAEYCWTSHKFGIFDVLIIHVLGTYKSTLLLDEVLTAPVKFKL